MLSDHPTLTTADGRRKFAAFAAAVLVFLVDEGERLLMLAHPHRPGRWEVVNGAMDAGETILEAALRETREEAGPDVRARPLGVIHAYTFRYDDAVSHMISIAYLCAYEGGEVAPGDDMAGSAIRWWSLAEIEAEQPTIIAPGSPNLRWLFRRAIELYRTLKDQPRVALQPDLSSMKNKYER